MQTNTDENDDDLNFNGLDSADLYIFILGILFLLMLHTVVRQ